MTIREPPTSCGRCGGRTEKKTAQAQEQQQEESGAQKSDKLLPFLNAKAEHHQSRIDSLDEKIANQTDKIDRNKAKIEA